MLFVSHFLLLSLQCKHSLWYNLLFSHSNNFSIDLRVLLLRQITGHILQPKVQQQQRHPQSSHRTLTGRFFLRQLLTLLILALNSSGATFPVKDEGNSASNLLLSPNLLYTGTHAPYFLTAHHFQQILHIPLPVTAQASLVSSASS